MGCKFCDDLVVGVVSIDSISLRLAFQLRLTIAVGSTVWSGAIAAARIDDNARRFWPDVKLVTGAQTSDADTGMDANALDVLGHGSLPPEIAVVRKEHRSH